MRLAAAGVLAALLAGCAHIEAPTGGPEDTQGPSLISTRPDTMARMESFPGPVVLVFDEGLSEEKVEEAVEVSPRTSSVSVEKRGDELRVDLRRGWERGRVYQVTVEPILTDRFRNAITAPVHLVFSTGPEIPSTQLGGVVIERTTNNAAQRVRVEAILAPDSLVYATRTDSVGRFEFRQIPPGRYAVRAFNDPNKNRALESYESRDTAGLEVAPDRPAEVELSIITPDSTGPRLTAAAMEGEVISLRFDDFLDPTQPLDRIQVRLVGPDSAAVAVQEIRVGGFPQAAAQDSTVQDSTVQDSAGARQQPLPADTARADSARPQRPAPAQVLAVRPAAPLTPETTYRVTVTGVRNLLGLEGGGSAQFRTLKLQLPAVPAQAQPAPDAERPAPQPIEPPARPPR